MKFIKTFAKKPRNIYFSIILMLTLVTGLASISFSYYIDESSTDGVLKYGEVDNRIQSEDIVDGMIVLAPHETKDIGLCVMSNNNFESNFKLYYKTDDNAKVLSNDHIKSTITAKEVQYYSLAISNFSDTPASLVLDIASSDLNSDVTFLGTEVEVME